MGAFAVYTPFLILLLIVIFCIVLGKILISPKGAGSLLGHMLTGLALACVVIFSVTWFLSGDSIRSMLN